MFLLTLLALLLTLLALITISTPHPCTASQHPPAAQLTTPLFNHSLHPLSLKGGENFRILVLLQPQATTDLIWRSSKAAASAGEHPRPKLACEF
jgi:hypothetical protein